MFWGMVNLNVHCMITSLKQRKIKSKPKIKLNHNKVKEGGLIIYYNSSLQTGLCSFNVGKIPEKSTCN